MSLDYINEAFRSLDSILNEETFDTSLTGLNSLSDFMDNDDTSDLVRVIDDEATTEDELKDSYIGKVIVNCNVCHSHVFKDKENIVIDSDNLVNAEDICPYCGEQEGFTVVGEIAPFTTSETEEDAAVEETPAVEEPAAVEEDPTVETSEDETPVVEESLTEENRSYVDKALSMIEEDFKNVSITTEDQHLEMSSDENGKVTVTTEPVTTVETSDEMIVPVSDATQMDIEANNSDVVSDESDVDMLDTSLEDETDVDFDEVDEESFDDLGEQYLKRVYENVDSYKTTAVKETDSKLVVEGILKFKSGTEKKTGFIFEAKDINSKGSLRFNGCNQHLTEAVNAYTLVGKVTEGKLVLESFKYNYSTNGTPIRGIVRRTSKE